LEQGVSPDLRTDTDSSASTDDIQKLRRAIRELSILNDLAREIGASLDPEHITSTIVRRSVRAVRAEQGLVILRDRFGDRDMRTLTRSFASSSMDRPLHIEESLLGWMQINKQPLLLNQPRHDARFSGVDWDETFRSVLCVPLLVEAQLIGVLAVFNKSGASGFNDDDQRLLSILAAQSAQVLENARLHEREEALLRVQEEIRLASEIQLRLLPKEAPVVAGYDIAGASLPADMVGGDYFDFLSFADGRLGLCLGDVSGKGLSAAILMANLQAAIRAQTLLDLPLGRSMANANTLLSRSTDPDKFATCFLAALDPQRHEIRYSNAGHDPPLLLSEGGQVDTLCTGGLVLGFAEQADYDSECVAIEPNGALVIYSDGITEAADAEDRQFGEEGLREILLASIGEPAEEVIRRTFQSVKEHSGSDAQPDDMTLVVVKRNAL
jgi:sigma-B regulation protein RsbU (phosphoserine phosphatase)